MWEVNDVSALNTMFKQAEAGIRELDNCLQKIKKQMQNLAEENAALRKQLALAYGQVEKNEQDQTPGGAFKNLMFLYNQGFHVCNVHFAYTRRQECLFCNDLLERDGKKSKLY